MAPVTIIASRNSMKGVVLKDQTGYFCNLLFEPCSYSDKFKIIEVYRIGETFKFTDLLKRVEELKQNAC